MIYRIVISNPKIEDGKLKTHRGGMFANCSEDDVFDLDKHAENLGLKAPKHFENKKARFWFTKSGWNHVGRVLVNDLIKLGYHIKIIKKKNPSASSIVYRDAFQVALLSGG